MTPETLFWAFSNENRSVDSSYSYLMILNYRIFWIVQVHLLENIMLQVEFIQRSIRKFIHAWPNRTATGRLLSLQQ